MYVVEESQRATKFLEKLDNHLRERIREGLRKLRDTPVPHDAKFIGRHQDDKVFRHRIGDYRALYKIKEQEKIVLVTKVDKRPRIYHRGGRF